MDINIPVYEKAALFALNAHRGQTRKNGKTPAVMHLFEVASIISTMTDDYEVISAGLLHDTVEDTDVTIDDIEREFGQRIRDLVASETENKRQHLAAEQTWMIRKQESLEWIKNSTDRDAKIVWMADKLSNIRSFNRLYAERGEDMWQMFHQHDPKVQKWYYDSVADALQELQDTMAYKEYVEIKDRLFNKY